MNKALEWILVAMIAGGVGVAFALVASSPWPRCKPGDPGVVVGGMLVGGCPQDHRLIYRNDGSVTPP